MATVPKKHVEPKWRARLRDLMVRAGIGAKPLSREAGLSERQVGQLLKTTDNPGVNTLAKVARVFGLSLGEIYDGEMPGRQRVRIVGTVAAGEGWTVYDDDLGEIELAIQGGEPVALQVKGESMVPVYRDGDIIAGGKRSGTGVERLIGRDCIVMTDDGRRFVKF